MLSACRSEFEAMRGAQNALGEDVREGAARQELGDDHVRLPLGAGRRRRSAPRAGGAPAEAGCSGLGAIVRGRKRIKRNAAERAISSLRTLYSVDMSRVRQSALISQDTGCGARTQPGRQVRSTSVNFVVVKCPLTMASRETDSLGSGLCDGRLEMLPWPTCCAPSAAR